MMNNMNQYGRRPGENINDPLIILPTPTRPPYPAPYPPGWFDPIGRPCNRPGCRHHDHDRDRDRDRHDRDRHDRDRHDRDRHDRDRHDNDHRRRGPWY